MNPSSSSASTTLPRLPKPSFGKYLGGRHDDDYDNFDVDDDGDDGGVDGDDGDGDHDHDHDDHDDEDDDRITCCLASERRGGTSLAQPRPDCDDGGH